MPSGELVRIICRHALGVARRAQEFRRQYEEFRPNGGLIEQHN
jgi:hypothetical protein